MGGLICCGELLLCRCGESGVGGVELGKSGREIALKRVRKASEQGGTLRCGNAGGSHLDLIYFLPCPAVGLIRAVVVRTYQVGDDLFIGRFSFTVKIVSRTTGFRLEARSDRAVLTLGAESTRMMTKMSTGPI